VDSSGARKAASIFLSYVRFSTATEASQILEFAVALPLLVVLVVGIFDFSQAFNLKQKLNNAAREGARFASSLPTNDLSDSTACGAPPSPASVCAVRDLVAAYLQWARINDCGLTGQGATAIAPWTYVASGNGCPAGANFTLTIDRGYAFPATVPGASGPLYLVSSRVTLSYPYQWHFGKVIRLLVPGATYATTSQISTDAVVPNMD
jgi:Flp pilus assembly protein TadG